MERDSKEGRRVPLAKLYERFRWRNFATVIVLVVGCIASVLVYFLLDHFHQENLEQEYETAVENIRSEATVKFENVLSSARLLASITGTQNPNIEAWPNVTVPNFSGVADRLVDITAARSFGFAPLLPPGEVGGFETFVYDYYDSAYPGEALGESAFGRGIYRLWVSEVDGFPPPADFRVRDGSGIPKTHDSPYDILAPLIQSNSMGATTPGTYGTPLLLDLASETSTFGGIAGVDEIISCVNNATAKGNTSPEELENCTMWTLMSIPLPIEATPTLFAITMVPVFPENNRTQLAGVITAQVDITATFHDVISMGAKGIDLVLNREGISTYSYEFADDGFLFTDDEDQDTRRSSEYEVQTTFPCSNAGLGICDAAAVPLTYSLFPNAAYVRNYDDFLAEICAASVGAFTLVMALSIFYILTLKEKESILRERGKKDALLDVRRRFVRLISHEIRTPLNVICLGFRALAKDIDDSVRGVETSSEPRPVSGAARRIQQGDANASLRESYNIGKDSVNKWRELLDSIDDSCQSATLVLEDMLNYDNIESGLYSLDIVGISLQEFIHKMKVKYDLVASKHDIAFGVHYLPSEESMQPLYLMADYKRLSQVMHNVLNNAIKYTPSGGSVSINARWNPSGKVAGPDTDVYLNDEKSLKRTQRGSVTIEVVDTGQGMGMTEQQEINTTSRHFDATQFQGRVAIGVLISKSLLKSHGGTLYMRSGGDGKGTTVVINLPVYKPYEAALENGSDEDVLALMSQGAKKGSSKTHIASSNGSASRKYSQIAPDAPNSRNTSRKSGIGFVGFDDISPPSYRDLDEPAESAGNPRMTTAESSSRKKRHSAGVCAPGASNAVAANSDSANDNTLKDTCRDADGDIEALKSGGRKVLLVDDVLMCRKMTQLLLKKHNCTVAKDGVEAVMLYCSAMKDGEPFDAILMDSEMPVMKGPDATRIIKRMGKKVFIAGVTGNVLPDDVATFRGCGADAVLSKPLDVDALYSHWHKFLTQNSQSCIT